MVFSVYDQGMRIKTPWHDVFPPRHVGQTSAIAPSHNISTDDLAKDSQNTVPPQQQQQQQQQQGLSAYYSISHQHEQERRPIYTANQLMSPTVITINRNSTIETAWQLFKQHRFRHIPVVDHLNRLQGMLADRDLLQRTSNLIQERNDSSSALGNPRNRSTPASRSHAPVSYWCHSHSQ
jgi:CBS-domain-containing membrane protein